jgi:hypothetical protein
MTVRQGLIEHFPAQMFPQGQSRMMGKVRLHEPS